MLSFDVLVFLSVCIVLVSPPVGSVLSQSCSLILELL